MYSTIIKNGTVFDGSGSKGKKTDIALKNGKISRIGDLSKEKAELTIDASDLYIMPGFVDLTTHSDTHWTIFSQPRQESFIRQGITTIIGGHGGFSLAPVINKDAIEFLNRWVDAGQLNINWQTMAEFLKEIEKHSPAVNFATFVGLETIRRNALEKATVADKQEIKKINLLLEQALDDGAFGLSTNFGAPYSQFASEAEIISVFETIKKRNCVSTHHLKDEGKNISPAVSQLLTLARQTKVQLHISHLKAIGRTAWEQFDQLLEMIELAQAQEINLTCDFFPYLNTGSNLTSFLPPWALNEGEEKTIDLIKNKEKRANIIEYIKSLTLHYEKILVASANRDSASIGKSIKQISEDSELIPEEVILDLLLINNLQVAIFNEVIQEKNLESLAKKNYSMITSDGVGYEIDKIKDKKDLPHPRSFGTFPKIFSQLVKEKKILTWEEAIYKMTSLPAATLGLKDRGILKEENIADIIIINPETIKDTASYELPLRYAKGVEYVFVNGVLTLSEDKFQNTGAGQVLRKK